MKISIDVKKAYIESWKATFSTLRELKGYSSDNIKNYYEGIARGISRVYISLAVQSSDFDTYDFIKKHTKKMILRVNRILEG